MIKKKCNGKYTRFISFLFIYLLQFLFPLGINASIVDSYEHFIVDNYYSFLDESLF